MFNETTCALILDDVERPSALDDVDDEALIEPEDLEWEPGTEPASSALPPPDEDHMLARMMGAGGRDGGARTEGDELLDDDSETDGTDDESEWSAE